MRPIRLNLRRGGGRAVRRKPGEMNGLERRYALLLDQQLEIGSILSFQHEAIKLRLAEKTFYEPDFLVVAADEVIEIHEVKGSYRDKATGQWKPFVEDDAAVKFKVAARLFPFRFRMVWFDTGKGIWCEDQLATEALS